MPHPFAVGTMVFIALAVIEMLMCGRSGVLIASLAAIVPVSGRGGRVVLTT